MYFMACAKSICSLDFLLWGIRAALLKAQQEEPHIRPYYAHCILVLIRVRPFSGGGQTDANGDCRCCARREGSDGAMPAYHAARPQQATPDSLHAGTAVPTGAGVWKGELRFQTPALRTGHGAQLTWDNNKGRLLCCSTSPAVSEVKSQWHFIRVQITCQLTVRLLQHLSAAYAIK